MRGVICRVCGEWVEVLTHTHMRERHQTTQFEYLIHNPDHCVSTLWGNPHGDAARKQFRKLKRQVMAERKERGL